ncbi:uncharacterized protein BXZ73DRAFT_39592, partial [Epithele typhae]|uniref:uncharacterized protein n=1 Tax=Epithele typhae TaxID=378194 RepID=UPI00200867A5
PRMASRSGDVIEVQGPAASGKTHFLYHMILTCLLPSQHHHASLSGWAKAAVVLDTDGTFNVSRLHELLSSRIRRLLRTIDNAVSEDEVTSMATQCLERLLVLRPTSSVQLAITILNLHNILTSDARLCETELGLVAIDSLSAFYWRDRFALEQLRNSSDRSSEAALPSNPTHHIVNALHQFRRAHRPVILLSNWGLNSVSKPTTADGLVSPFYRQHLHPFPAPFDSPHGAAEVLSNISTQRRPYSGNNQVLGTAFQHSDQGLPIHHHITLQRSPVDPFPASYSLADASAQDHMRAKLVERAEIKGFVRTPGSTDIGTFVFRVGLHEILLNDDQPRSELRSDHEVLESQDDG